MTRIRSFNDQDLSRFSVAKIAARAVEDILYILDSATAPSGESGTDPSPDEIKSYNEFRDWFGPQVGATIQGLVVGPLLSNIVIYDDGLIDVENSPNPQFVDSSGSAEERTKARLIWLAEEIPSLAETYKQLEEDEVVEALAVCDSIWSMVNGSEYNQLKAIGILQKAEHWFMFAQPGAKILRGDKEAIAALLEFTDQLKGQVDTFEQNRASAMSNLESKSLRVDDVPVIKDELNRVEALIVNLESQLAAADKRASDIREQLSRV